MKEEIKLWIAVATTFTLLFLFFYILDYLDLVGKWYGFPTFVLLGFTLIFIGFCIISELFPEGLIDEDKKTIKRMEVGIQNLMDREKELLERIKYLEGLTK